MGGIGDIAMMLVIGGVGLYALYAYNQGALGTTPATTPVTDTGYVDPGVTDTGTTGTTDTGYTGNEPSAVASQCEEEGGVWQGHCCSCPDDPDCHNKCGGGDDPTNKEACEHEGGVWEANTRLGSRTGCCRCPNISCSLKCGSTRAASGGLPGDISEDEKAEGLCLSEGKNDWNITKKCCSCPGRDCRNQCKETRVPLKESTSTKGAKTPVKSSSTPTSRAQSSGGGVGGPGKVVAKPKPAAPKPCAAKCTPLKNSPSTYAQCCKANVAHAYLGSAFNRRGPSYSYRDDYRHLTNVENPTVDAGFEYQSKKKPYYLGAAPDEERWNLIRRFRSAGNANSNYANMRFSG